jgi:hypothetical protein
LGSASAAYRVTHRSDFQVDEAKQAIEMANAEFGSFMTTARTLANIKVDSARAEELTLKLVMKANEETARASASFNRIMGLFNGEGKGSNLSSAHDTAWGWLNAVTEYADHHIRTRSVENRTASALWGTGDTLKEKALDLVTTN